MSKNSANDKNKEYINNVSFAINKKENTTFTYKEGFKITFYVEIVNNNSLSIESMTGSVLFKSYENDELLKTTINLNVSQSVSAKSKRDFLMTQILSDSDSYMEIWKSELINLNIYFRIVSIKFGDGTIINNDSNDYLLINKATTKGIFSNENDEEMKAKSDLEFYIQSLVGTVPLPDNYSPCAYSKDKCYINAIRLEKECIKATMNVSLESINTYYDSYVDKLLSNGYSYYDTTTVGNLNYDLYNNGSIFVGVSQIYQSYKDYYIYIIAFK